MTYGRDELADLIGRSEASLLLATGDSGIGKSTVLQLATAERAGWVYAEPRALIASSGSLYQGFLDSLALALGILIDGGLGAPTIGDRLAETAARLANERAAVLGRLAVAELLTFLRGRFAGGAGDSLAAYAKSIWPDTAATLTVKALQARDPLAVDVLVTLAETAIGLGGDLHLCISLDEGERMSDDDRRLAADLAERLPHQFHVRVAFATDTAERADSVSDLAAGSSRLAIHEVEPLSVEAVAAWLSAEGLSASDAPAVSRETGGYPLRLEAAVLHLQQGGVIGDLPRDDQFVRRTRASWKTLSPRAAAVARSLAVLGDPLPVNDLRSLAGVADAAEWATVVEELDRTRIFSVDVNGIRWFHRERRAFVLNDCLSDGERAEVASAAAELIWPRLSEDGDFSLAGQFAELVSMSPALQASERHLAAAAVLDGPALAAAAALLELATEDKVGAIDAVLFAHALRFIDRIEDPAAVTAELEDSGLVQTASNDHATAFAAAWGPKTQAVIQGRTALRLGKAAVPWIVEAAFALALREPLGAFESAHLGIGAPSMGGLARLSVGLDPEPSFARGGFFNRRHFGTNLLMRGTVDGLPLYCSATFSTAEARDKALRAVTRLDQQTPIGPVRVDAVMPHPVTPVPVQRFAMAAARAAGQHAPSPHDSGDIRVDAPAGLDDQTLVEMRVETVRALRALATPIEEGAMELDNGFLLLWDGGDDFWDECMVTGAGDGARREPLLSAAPISARYEGLRLRQSLGLRPGQTITRRMTSGGTSIRREDPVFAEIAARRTRARIFNSAQPKLQVKIDPDELKRVIEDGFRAELADARQLQSLLHSLSEEPEIGPTTLWMLIVLDEPSTRWVAGARGIAWYAEGPSQGDSDRVEIECVTGEPHGEWVYDVDPQMFGRVFSEAPGPGVAALHYKVCRYMRHHTEDVEFGWPDRSS